MTRPLTAGRPAPGADDAETVDGLIKKARSAMAVFANADQARVDEAVTALAWSIYRPDHARALAETAVSDTGLGNVADKTAKNRRKTFGTLRDLLRARSVGAIEEDRARGLVIYAKPVGVVAAITPSTNPANKVAWLNRFSAFSAVSKTPSRISSSGSINLSFSLLCCAPDRAPCCLRRVA